MKVGDEVKVTVTGKLDYVDETGIKVNGHVFDTGEYDIEVIREYKTPPEPKVGDRVKVLMVDKGWREYNTALDGFVGKTGMVTETDCFADNTGVYLIFTERGNGKVVHSHFYFHKDWLEVLPATTELVLEPGKEYNVDEIGKAIFVFANPIQKIFAYYDKENTAWKIFIAHDHNIIGPWNPKPVVDWSLYSKWTKGIAQFGLERKWAEYPNIPHKDHFGMIYEFEPGCHIIPPEYAPKNPDGTPWEGAWEDSLVLRPEE